MQDRPEPVVVTQVGRVVTATLTNPPSAYMTMAMVTRLADLVAAWESDDGVGAVVLTGAHPTRFLAHFDIADLLVGAEESPPLPSSVVRAALSTVTTSSRVPGVSSLLSTTPASGLVDLVRLQRMLLDMGRSGVVYLAAINGSTMGGGCELALACDWRVMASGEAHRIGQLELLLGYPPGGGGTQRLARLLGQARALELTLGAEPVSPQRALEIGLVTELAADGDVVARTQEIAARLARRSKTGVRALKRAVRDGGSLPLEQGLRTEAVNFFRAVTSDDSRRLMAAYVATTERLGDAAAYDPTTMAAAIDGTLVDLHGPPHDQDTT